MPPNTFSMNEPIRVIPPSKKIRLKRTQGEWELLEKKLKEKNTDFHSYLRNESSRLRNLFKECQPCVTQASGIKTYKRHNIPTDIYNDFVEIAVRMQKDVATVIDEFLISPMLRPDKDAVRKDFL